MYFLCLNKENTANLSSSITNSEELCFDHLLFITYHLSPIISPHIADLQQPPPAKRDCMVHHEYHPVYCPPTVSVWIVSGARDGIHQKSAVSWLNATPNCYVATK